jgi:hypothetical protein
MPSIYLRPEDYAPYGVPGSTEAQVVAASAIVDGYLRRPEGMIWVPDFQGMPCYMKAMKPRYSFTITAPIPAGAQVHVAVPGFPANPDLIGEVAIIDRATPTKTEGTVIQNIAAGVMTLANVALAHDAGTVIDLGMCIFEERTLTNNRSIARVSRSPIERLLSGLGRYGFGRRLDQKRGMYGDANLLTAIAQFGGPPMWTPFDVNQASVSQPTNEIWIPAGIMLAYFSDVRLRYVAGYTVESMPDILRSATALVVTSQIAAPELIGNLKMAKAGDTAIQRFSDSILDTDIKGLLDEFRARLVV